MSRGLGDVYKRQGTVKDMAPAGADYEITVDFGKLGVKKLMSKFANLKKI